MYYWGVFLCCSTSDQASRLAESGEYFDDLFIPSIMYMLSGGSNGYM